jgi:hypothetical protein
VGCVARFCRISCHEKLAQNHTTLSPTHHRPANLDRPPRQASAAPRCTGLTDCGRPTRRRTRERRPASSPMSRKHVLSGFSERSKGRATNGLVSRAQRLGEKSRRSEKRAAGW